jgi:hypothetical protein
MEKWTWQWLALIGLIGIIFGGYSWVRLELDPPTNEILEPDIELYHEQYVDGHVLVKTGRVRNENK